MTTVAPNLKVFLERTIPIIEEEMFSFLPVQEPEDFLYRPMRDYPERGGKRFRPALLLIACQALDGDFERAVRTAAAFEMFQSFALLHDDIEDDSEVRRGKPCIHKLHGIPLSVNIGDATYAKVFEMLAANQEILGCATTLNLIEEMIRGSRETFEGQAFDVGWIKQQYIPTEEEFMTMLRKKTGWYSGRGLCSAGAIIAGASDVQRENLGNFGEAMAIAFQIRDDLLNLSTSQQESEIAPGITSGAYGKERGGDIAEGKRTLIIIDLLRKCTDAEREEVLAILHQERQYNTAAEIERVIDLVDRYDSMEYAAAVCGRKADESRRYLERVEPSPARDLLGEMLDFLVARVF